MVKKLDWSTIKFVKIFDKDDKGNFQEAVIPVHENSYPKIKAYLDMGDMQPYNAANNDHGWRIEPEKAAYIREVLNTPSELQRIAAERGKPVDLVRHVDVIFSELAKQIALQKRIDNKEQANASASQEYEQAVAQAFAPATKSK